MLTQKPRGEASLARQHLIVNNLQTEIPAPTTTSLGKSTGV